MNLSEMDATLAERGWLAIDLPDSSAVFETRDHPFARSYLVSLYPAYLGEPEVLERSRGLLAQLNGSLPTLSRQLAEAADDLDRVIKVRAFAEKA